MAARASARRGRVAWAPAPRARAATRRRYAAASRAGRARGVDPGAHGPTRRRRVALPSVPLADEHRLGGRARVRGDVARRRRSQPSRDGRCRRRRARRPRTAPTSAKSPCRRATSAKPCARARPGHAGTSISARSSSARARSSRRPRKKSRPGTYAGHPRARQAQRPRSSAIMHGGQLGRGIGVGDAAADGPPRPRLQVPDDRRRLGEQRARQRRRARRARAPAGGRARPGRARLRRPSTPETGHAVQVHHHRRPHEAHVHHRHQALAPREELGLVAVARQEIERLLDRPRRTKYSNGAGRTRARARPGPASDDRTSAASRPTAPCARGSSR